MYQEETVSFVPSLPPELEEAKRAGMIAAANPAMEEEDEGIEVRMLQDVPIYQGWYSV